MKKAGPSKEVGDLFKHYANGSSIDYEGLEKFFSDLGIDSMDPVTLVLSYHMNCNEMGVVKREEFVTGFDALGCGSINDLKNTIPELNAQLKDNRQFKKIYKYVFDFLREDGVRNVMNEVGVGMLDLLLPLRFDGSHFEVFKPKLDSFFAKREEDGIKAMKKDEWNCLLDFLEMTDGGDVTKYEDDGSWPVMIDHLVEALK